jgi:hypothetical protein
MAAPYGGFLAFHHGPPSATDNTGAAVFLPHTYEASH